MTIVTVVTMKMTAGAVLKVSSPSSQPSRKPHVSLVLAAYPQIRSGQAGRKIRCSPCLRAADFEQIQIAKNLPAAPVFEVCTDSASRKRGWCFAIPLWTPERSGGVRPRRAHGTLQPQDESVIVDYYTSRRKCFPNAVPLYINQLSGGNCLWQETTVLIVPAQEI